METRRGSDAGYFQHNLACPDVLPTKVHGACELGIRAIRRKSLCLKAHALLELVGEAKFQAGIAKISFPALQCFFTLPFALCSAEEHR